jgi:ABC-type sulfate transport system substrate-binding protein
VVYPEINFWNDNPFYLLAAPWSSEAQKKGASAFMDFLMTEPIQKQLVQEGFRPGNPKVPILFPESPFERYKSVGLRVEIPVAAEIPPPAVVEALGKTAQLVMNGPP